MCILFHISIEIEGKKFCEPLDFFAMVIHLGIRELGLALAFDVKIIIWLFGLLHKEYKLQNILLLLIVSEDKCHPPATIHRVPLS